MAALEFDATELYGFKILRDADNRPVSLHAAAEEPGATVDAKVGQVKRHAPITAKIGDKIGDKAGVKVN